MNPTKKRLALESLGRNDFFHSRGLLSLPPGRTNAVSSNLHRTVVDAAIVNEIKEERAGCEARSAADSGPVARSPADASTYLIRAKRSGAAQIPPTIALDFASCARRRVASGGATCVPAIAYRMIPGQDV
jgi:hypothetical protein